MTEDEAKKLAHSWNKLGDAQCWHANLTIETSAEGYIPRNYFCLTCGSRITIRSVIPT